MNAVPSLTEMLQQLIATPSISSTLDELDTSNLAVIEKLEGWLDGLGFHTEVLPVEGHPGKANLIATLGSGSGGLVLSGHTDTVPFDAGRWNHDPFKLTEHDQRFYGLGSCDMKGFFALAIEAARQFVGQPLQQPLIILATADEETSMSGARALALAGKPKARRAVIGEPTGLKPVYLHKGMMMERVRLTGRAGHSSNPALGNNAMEAMHRLIAELLQFRQELQLQYQNDAFEVAVPTLNLGCIHGGDNPNRICGHCEMDFDLRPLPGMELEAIRDQIKHRLAPIAADLGVKFEAESLFSGIPAFNNQPDSELVRLAEKLTGKPAETVAFGTEAPFMQQLGMDTIVLGPGSIDQAHQPDEFLAFDQIQPTVELLQQLIIDSCLSPQPAVQEEPRA
ncbi:acetylornithine deacetylase [Motiliproteus coralliicola]|uniref:Acetylornithine deacetylase n=1 Tax=Motiliproteus coralliicola TaxID=2283196 RepID=A0A369WAQ3_9GAMM|nr:acetylornithine deacetylase [Motiliproteus coralliicola]RDE18737.1 acetylornithine deacetylase [Motiliproteus coralliicola]